MLDNHELEAENDSLREELYKSEEMVDDLGRSGQQFEYEAESNQMCINAMAKDMKALRANNQALAQALELAITDEAQPYDTIAGMFPGGEIFSETTRELALTALAAHKALGHQAPGGREEDT